VTTELGPLGRKSPYPEDYDPRLLHPVDRAQARDELGVDGAWPWFGEDLWQAYEVSWLAPGGLPEVRMAQIRIPAGSPCLIESKSLKLYFNSLNNLRLSGEAALVARLEKDLGRAAGAPVEVRLMSVDSGVQLVGRPQGYELLEAEPVEITRYVPDPALLTPGAGPVSRERWCSHLLKTNCPVTGQPDWGTLLIDYQGQPLCRGSLLRYIVGFRHHQGFHEHCVERIFLDLMRQCHPRRLTVSAHYTRRGGLDINPWRSTERGSAPGHRLARQ